MVYYEKPTHLLDALSELGYQKGDYPESERASEEVLSLPFHPYVTEEQALLVFEALEAALLERA
jgi:dTDP-4-amino-4,6-dideoxygalactose transaminase